MMRIAGTFILFVVQGIICLTPPIAYHSFNPYDGPLGTQFRSKREITLNDRESCRPGANHSQQMVNTLERLQMLRSNMSNLVDAYIIPSEDEHQSAYVADHDKRRQYISGFSGSAGYAVVTATEAALWTDGRYFLQAEQELDCNWLLMKSKVADYPTITKWLVNTLPIHSRVAADPRLVPYVVWQEWNSALETKFISLLPLSTNMIDNIWTTERGRPPASKNPVYILEDKFTGKSWMEKIKEVRQSLNKVEADMFVVTALDEVAWLFNLRGSDVPYNPLFHAYAIVTNFYIRLYIKNPDSLTSEAQNYLKVSNCNKSTCVKLAKYENMIFDLIHEGNKLQRIMISPESSYAVYLAIPEDRRLIDVSPISRMKVVKNQQEQENMKRAHVKDAVALIQFLSLLEKEIPENKMWDELKAKQKIEEFRRQQEYNKGPSFRTISAVGPNAAIIHYSSQESTNRKLTTTEIYLLDSGGQYLDGTTDVTRTMHYGTPKDFEKEAYTRVLMGHIDLATAVFPNNVEGQKLDIIARAPLWEAGLDYRHGTGHGIGAFLSVHEAPNMHLFAPGIFTSDEPGYYEDGKFGIRLETILMAKEAHPPHNFGNLTYLTFEPITLVPFEPKLIKFELLNTKQRKWFNLYNKKIREIVGTELQRQNKTSAFNWMFSKTEDIPNDCISVASTNKQSQCLQIYSFIFASGLFTKIFWL